MNSSIDGSKYKINYLFPCIDRPKACTDCGGKSHGAFKRGYCGHCNSLGCIKPEILLRER